MQVVLWLIFVPEETDRATMMLLAHAIEDRAAQPHAVISQAF